MQEDEDANVTAPTEGASLCTGLTGPMSPHASHMETCESFANVGIKDIGRYFVVIVLLPLFPWPFCSS